LDSVKNLAREQKDAKKNADKAADNVKDIETQIKAMEAEMKRLNGEIAEQQETASKTKANHDKL
jgi:chromosome segregation ATPase